MQTNLIGDLPGYSVVWYHRNRIANILSLENFKNKDKVAYDSSNGNQFVAHKSDGTTHIFKQSRCGKQSVTQVNTVEDKKSKYTVNAYNRATVARELHCIIEGPAQEIS